MKTVNFYGLFLSLTLLACEKEQMPLTDTTAPEIQILSPADGDRISTSAIGIVVEILENQELHEYSVVIRNKDRSYARTVAQGHAHTNDLTIDQEWIITPHTRDTFTLTVKANDHNGNQGSSQIEFFHGSNLLINCSQFFY
ncbi:MAG: hypothetical protein R2795_03220 [Saprospiraceae bacterium]